MLNRRLAGTPEAEHEKTGAYKRFTYEGLVSQAEARDRLGTARTETGRPAQ